jgi:hypothetical protein
VLARLNPANRKIEHVRAKATGETEPRNGDLSKGISPRVLLKKRYYGYANLISACCIFFLFFLKGVSMKIVIASLVSALMLLSMPTFAGSHGGGKIDCKDTKNKDHKDCQKK